MLLLLLTLPGAMPHVQCLLFYCIVVLVQSVLFAPPPADPARHNATCSVFAVLSVCCVAAVHMQSVLFTSADPARHNAPCSVFAVLVQYMYS